jgi:hypothetical protein
MIAAAILHDTDVEVATLDRVEFVGGYYELHREDGWSFSYQASEAPHFEPRIGDVARFYGRGVGFVVRGLVIRGRTIFYRTEAEQRAKDDAEIAERKAQRIAEFEATGRAALDAKYAALPPIFQTRIDKFRRNSPSFRVDYEPYEMFCCEEAVKLAAALGTEAEVRHFGALSFDEQKTLVPDLAYAEHSGNTFGVTLRLAHLYLAKPEGVEQLHGALAPLVGSEEYGCVPPADSGDASRVAIGAT